METVLKTIHDVTSSLLPLIGIVVLVILGVLLFKVIKIVNELNLTVNKVNQTIDVVDKSIEMLQQPLQTVASLSHSIDSIHFFSEKAIRGFMKNTNDLYERVKTFVMQLFSKKETDTDVAAVYETPEEVVVVDGE